jgi:hypothetical protein
MILFNKKSVKRIAFKSLLCCIPLTSLLLVSNSSGRDGYNTGSPGENGVTCTQCHNSNPQDYDASLSITTNIPEEGYALNTTYTIDVAINSTASKHGFLINAERLNDNLNVGSFSAGANSQIKHSGEHVTHENANSTSWSFTWTSPLIDEGQIKFYAAGVAGNGNGNAGDQVVTTSSQIVETLSVQNLSEQKVHIYPNPIINDLTIILPNNYNDATYRVNDLTGKIVAFGAIPKTENTIQLKQLPAGIYTIDIQCGHKRSSSQIIKY